ncbi:hypothetical protein [Moellerella wisconsensis]|uniref:Uncharacterized protein n=2 Tax=Moellerella wisconsensis TaxID=158849 RepID=A0ACD3Y730_9GAMM|nr:hypothetical protein [Moellerella wisconsensis]KLN96654.1 hypothetical protein VK86_08895 [Moellerella wisconsensis]UNH38613.1 hypothetical protein MNY70_14270 [Moellerella wisconsensis]
MKKSILTAMAICIPISLISFTFYYLKPKVYTCEVNSVWYKKINHTAPLVMLTKNKVILSDNKQGILSIHGSVSKGEQDYIINRSINVTYEEINKKGNYKINFTSSTVKSNDNIPDNVLGEFIQIGANDISYYARLFKYEDGIYILRSEDSSRFICYSE